MTTPTLERRPTHKVLPLLGSEISRITHRRLFRVLIALLFGGILLISTIAFFMHSKSSATLDVERAQSRQAHAQMQWEQCTQNLMPDEPAEDMCGPEPGSQPLENFTGGADDRYRAYELIPVALMGTAIAMAGIAFVMGASSGGAEWSSRSMTLQLLFEPRRLRLLCVKWLGLLVSMAVVAALAMSLSVGIGALSASARGTWDSRYALDGMAGGLWPQLLAMGGRAVVLVAFAATFGYAIAMLVRNTGASLGVAFVYFVVFENGVRIALMRYGAEPFLLTDNAVASVLPGGIPDVPGKLQPSGEFTSVHLGNLRAFGTLLFYAALISVPAAWSFTRRDVS